jgi:type I restriction enzyme S subunit
MKILTPNFHGLKRWDFKSALAEDFRAAHADFVPLGTFVEEATDLVNPASEPAKEWPVYGVSARDGVFFSHSQAGGAFKGNYKRIRRDWFFHNPTRANIGSIGRVPEVPSDALTSPEYQVWRPKKGVDPDYIEVLVKSRLFVSLVEIHRVGSVKERLFVANLLEIPVPVLSNVEQAALIKGVRAAKQELIIAQQNLAVEMRLSEKKLSQRVSAEYLDFATSASSDVHSLE